APLASPRGGYKTFLKGGSAEELAHESCPLVSNSSHHGFTALAKSRKWYQSPPKYKPATDKNLAKAHQRLGNDPNTYIVSISSSKENLFNRSLFNPLTSFWKIIHFLNHHHQLSSEYLKSSPIYARWCKTANPCKMVQHWPDNKSNQDRLGGSMHGIGFCQGYDSGKSGGRSVIIIVYSSTYHKILPQAP
ncbi:hypothetical protein VP01_2750g1, partial [Puccinia sorghi]